MANFTPHCSIFSVIGVGTKISQLCSFAVRENNSENKFTGLSEHRHCETMDSCAKKIASIIISPIAMDMEERQPRGDSLFTKRRTKIENLKSSKFMPITITAFRFASLFNVLPFQWDSRAKKFSSEPQGIIRRILHKFMLICVTLDFAYTLGRVAQVIVTHWPIHRSERLSDAILLLGLLGPKMWTVIDTYHPSFRREDAISFTNQLIHYRLSGMKLRYEITLCFSLKYISSLS